MKLLRLLVVLLIPSFLLRCCPEHTYKDHEWHYVVVGNQYWIYGKQNELILIVERGLVDPEVKGVSYGHP